MPKQLKDILNGVKSSKIVPGSTGSDPGVDYAPKAPNEQEFVKKHKIEKHENRVGNDDELYNASKIKHSIANEPSHGYKKPDDKAVNEGKKLENREKMINDLQKNGYSAEWDLLSTSKLHNHWQKTLLHPALRQKNKTIKTTKEELEQVDEEDKNKHKSFEAWGEYGPTAADKLEIPHIKAKDHEEAHRKAVSHFKIRSSPYWKRMGKHNVYVREIPHPKKTNEEIGEELEQVDEAARGEIFKKQASKAKKEGDIRSFHYNMYKYHAHKSDVASFNHGLRSKEAKTHENKANDHRERYKSFQEEYENFNSGAEHGTGSAEQIAETHKVGDKVKIVKGEGKGIEGHIGEIRHGLFKSARKEYTIYHGQNNATRAAKEQIRKIKEQTAPYDGSIGMSGAPRDTVPSFSADVNTGRVV
jgi:phage replication-related protein YjqB (UPF0714/DUF867 family)